MSGPVEAADGRTAYLAALYFDDGDNPIAGVDDANFWPTPEAARAALLDKLPTLDATGGCWVGIVEKGSWISEDYDPPYLPPSWTADSEWSSTPVLGEDNRP